MEDLPEKRVLVDLDCAELGLSQAGRCDYVYFDEDGISGRVVPIELKSGGFRPSHVTDQLQQGAEIAAGWIPHGLSLQLVPVLVHGKGIRRPELDRLLKVKITLRGRSGRLIWIKCGDPLKTALEKASEPDRAP